MRKIIKKTVALLAAVTTMFAVSTGPVWADAEPAEEQKAQSEAAKAEENPFDNPLVVVLIGGCSMCIGMGITNTRKQVRRNPIKNRRRR